MKRLQILYYRILIFFLDLKTDITYFLVSNNIIPEWEYSKRFCSYLQRKAVINKRIRKIGGLGDGVREEVQSRKDGC